METRSARASGPLGAATAEVRAEASCVVDGAARPAVAPCQSRFSFALSFRHLRNRQWIEGLKKGARLIGMKIWIACFDTQKKSILRRALELGDIEQRMMWTRQAA